GHSSIVASACWLTTVTWVAAPDVTFARTRPAPSFSLTNADSGNTEAPTCSHGGFEARGICHVPGPPLSGAPPAAPGTVTRTDDDPFVAVNENVWPSGPLSPASQICSAPGEACAPDALPAPRLSSSAAPSTSTNLTPTACNRSPSSEAGKSGCPPS